MYRKNIENCFETDSNFEVIGIDNTKGGFTSAASALNYGAGKAAGDVLMFVHQDIVFDGLEDSGLFFNLVNKINDMEIIGVAGAKYPSKDTYTNMHMGTEGQEIYGAKIDGPTTADTVDECLFCMKKETWEQFKLDEICCDSWHLYAVEICLRMRANGGSVKIIPADGLRHTSMGELNFVYFRNLKELIKKYPDMKHIWTTCVKYDAAQKLFFPYNYSLTAAVKIVKAIKTHSHLV